MNIKYFIPLLVVSLIIGFFVGNSVFADNVVPGSEEDPLVTKGNVDDSLNKKVEELEEKVLSLEGKVEVLQQQIAFLEDKIDQKVPEANVEQKKDNNEASSNQASVKKVAYVKEDNSYGHINTRKGPGTNYDLVAKVYKGHPMQIIKEENQWYQVKLEDGKTAWVASWIVDVRNE